MNNISLKIALLSLKQRQLMIRADAASDKHKWITTETGSHIKVDGDGNIVAGAGGKFNGKPLSEMGGTKKFTKYATNAERAETAKQANQTQTLASSPVLSNNLTKQESAGALSSTSQSEAANGDRTMTPQMDFFEQRISAKGYSLGKESNGLIEIKDAKTDTIALIDPSTMEVEDFKGRMKRKGVYLQVDASVARGKKEYGLYEAEKNRDKEYNDAKSLLEKKSQAARDLEAKATEEKNQEKLKNLNSKKDSIGKTAELIIFKSNGFLSQKERDFLNSISKKRTLSEKQDSWLRSISARFSIEHNSNIRANQSSVYREEEPDMPTQSEDGSWYDAETGLTIETPGTYAAMKHRFGG
jgi:hypothetical protein